MHEVLKTRWAAIGAAVAVSLGAGGVSLTQATIGSGEKPVFIAIEPCRLVDTRPATQIGPKSAPLGPNETLTLQITGSTGQCTDIPTGATAAAMNMTAIQPTAQSFFTVYPSDTDLPNASTLNWAAGDPPTPNKADVELGADGAVKVFNQFGTVHLAADLVGYYIDHHHDDRYHTKSEQAALFFQHIDDTTVTFDEDGAMAMDVVTFTAPADGRLLVEIRCNIFNSTGSTRLVQFRFGHGNGYSARYENVPTGSRATAYAAMTFELQAGEMNTYSTTMANYLSSTSLSCRAITTMQFFPDL